MSLRWFSTGGYIEWLKMRLLAEQKHTLSEIQIFTDHEEYAQLPFWYL